MAETEDIRDLSARLAANRFLVQASTGNTSVKTGDTLWIKASGKWLADAAAPDFLIPVALRRAKAHLDIGKTIPETENAGGPCASIETAMHALLPHKVVLHVHSVNAVAWAVRTDAPTVLRERLGGLSWRWIPYTLSGMPLAKRIQEASRFDSKANVFVLGNHGLVVCGESCDHAERLLEDVEKRLYLEPRPHVVSPHLAAATSEEFAHGSRSSDCVSIYGFAADLLSLTILRGGFLYPCQVLFLPSTVFAGDRLLVTQMACLRQHTRERPSPARHDKDRLLSTITMTQSQSELLFGLSQVVQRIYQSSAVHYLSCDDVTEIVQGGGQYLARAR